ncbi:porin [Caballeronia sp. dw_19]|uniref:porin n=1 Tax=Caballeronia sp. dw_19 TaxID=2719791 RepID=UPI001BD6BD40|nr:porin [Caballeronia sp. dw_19]
MRRLYALALTAVLACSQPALAQSSVTLYGVIDTGVEVFTHASPAGGVIARVPTISGGELPSRWGLRGVEDLGGDLKAVFQLENGFTPSSGTSLLGGREFGRQAFVGLSNRWGQLTIGRQNNMTLWGMANADVIGPAAFSIGDFDGYLANARADNMIEYRGTFSNLTLGLSYSFGRDTTTVGNCGGQLPGDQMSCRAITAMVKYDTARWGTAAIYDEQRGGAGATAMAVVPGLPGVAFTRSSDTDRRYQLNGYFMIDSVKIGGGWLHRRLEGDTRAVTTDMEYLGVSVPVVAWVFDAQISHLQDNMLSANGTLVAARAAYNLSKATAVYTELGYMFNGAKAVYSVSGTSLVPSIPAQGIDQAGIMVGIRHLF